jgi:hypothetical protein
VEAGAAPKKAKNNGAALMTLCRAITKASVALRGGGYVQPEKEKASAQSMTFIPFVRSGGNQYEMPISAAGL